MGPPDRRGEARSEGPKVLFQAGLRCYRSLLGDGDALEDGGMGV